MLNYESTALHHARVNVTFEQGGTLAWNAVDLDVVVTDVPDTNVTRVAGELGSPLKAHGGSLTFFVCGGDLRSVSAKVGSASRTDCSLADEDGRKAACGGGGGDGGGNELDGGESSVKCVVPTPPCDAENASTALLVFVDDVAVEVEEEPPSLAFEAPRVVSVTGGEALPTSGAQTFNVRGSGFGPSALVAQLHFGSYGPIDCLVADDGSVLTCVAPQGTGSGHAVRVTSARRVGASTEATVSYARPQLHSCTSDGDGPLPTTGGRIVTITGLNFGAKGTGSLTLVQYRSIAANRIYTAANASVSIGHKELQLETTAGVGKNLVFMVEIDGQTPSCEDELPGCDRHAAPEVTKVRRQPDEDGPRGRRICTSPAPTPSPDDGTSS